MIALPGPTGIDALMVALKQARGVPFRVTAGCEGVQMEREL
jgi:hypothetical protein